MQFPVFLLFAAACLAAAATGIIFQPGAWYAGLVKPGFTPPNIVFPVAWTVIYLLSAVAAARIAPLPGAGIAIGFWALQIALNTLWSPVFFGAHRMGLGMIVIAALWVVLAATIVAFWRLDRIAGALLVPYLVWITVAAALNFSIWQNNPGAGV